MEKIKDKSKDLETLNNPSPSFVQSANMEKIEDKSKDLETLDNPSPSFVQSANMEKIEDKSKDLETLDNPSPSFVQSANMGKIKDKSKDMETLNKFSVNQFVIKCRPISSQGKVHIVKKLLQHAKQYRQKRTKKEEEKEKNSRKADRFIQEVMFIKKLHPDEITKFSLLNKKTFKKVGDDPKSSIEERALCRLAEHKSVSAAIIKFREKYPKWDVVLQEIVKGLGLRHRKEKLKRLQQKGKIDTYLEKEQNSLKILQQVGVLKLDKKILDHGDKKTQPKKEDYLKDRPFNTHSQNKSLDPLEKQNTKDIHISEIENEEVNSDEGLGSSEEQRTELTQESETDSEADIMVTKLGQNLKDSGDKNDSSESDGDSDEENELEGAGDSDDESNIMVTKLGQNLKKSGDNDESSESDEDSDEENELEGVGDFENQNEIESDDSTTEEDLDTDNEESANVKQNNKITNKIKITNRTKKYLKKMNKKVIKTSPTKMSRTVEVKTIDLSVISDINMENNRQLKSETESEDEDFFKKPDKDGKIPKRKRKKNKSSFFLREGEENDGSESEVSEESDDDNYLKRQRADSDDDRIDTGKYFRKNIYRGDQPGGDNSNDRGRGRGGIDRGRGRGFDSQRNRGRDNERGRGRNFGSNKDSFNQDKNESSGFGGRGRGRGFNDSRGGRGRGFNDTRGGRGRGTGERGRGRPDRKFGNNGNESNANYIEINPNRTKSASIKAPGPIESVHPSWVAKQKMKQQSAGLNSFQGKRMTFDD